MISGLGEMSYENFKEALLILSEDFDCEIPFIPEPEMVKAVLGYVENDKGVALAYCVEKICNVLMDRDGMTEEEAFEYYSYNIERGAMYSSLNMLFVY